MKYESIGSAHEKLEKSFLVKPNNMSSKQGNAFKKLLERHPELR